MPAILLKPEQEQRAYVVRFHVRVSARASPDELTRARNWALERTIHGLSKQGWTFVGLSDAAPRGPMPVVPVKGFPKRPPKRRRAPGQPSLKPPPDDSLWRITTLPQFGPQVAHLMTDEVDWEYQAVFHRAAIPTAYAHEQGAPPPAWLKH